MRASVAAGRDSSTGGASDTTPLGKGEGEAGAGGLGLGAGGAAGAASDGKGGWGAGGLVGGNGGGAGGASAAGGALGKPMWRESREPFCPGGNDYPNFAAIWSDHRGVFVLASDAAPTPTIWSNFGKGWQTMYAWPEGNWLGYGGLRGFVDGMLVAYGFRCSIQFVSDSGAGCNGGPRETRDVAIVSHDLAYAIYDDRVLRFDGQLWTQLGDALPADDIGWVTAVWADASTVVVTGLGGYVYVIRSGQAPAVQRGLPVADFTAVWGFGANDIWIGDSVGQLYHYDGATWSAKASAGERGILRLWGNDGQLFVLTSELFGRWDGAKLVTLDSLDGASAYFQDLWGNSLSEVFVSLIDRAELAPGCGPIEVRWWNGNSVSSL